MNRPRLLVALAVAVGLLTGCGAAAVLSAGSQVPSLEMALKKVDSALAHGQYPVARSSLISLIDKTRSAERNGSISKAEATRIIGAARELLAQLPRPVRASTPVTTPALRQPSMRASPTPAPVPQQTPTTSPRPRSTATPTPRPTPTPTPTTTPDPTPSPSSSPTATTSPIALIRSGP